MGERPFVATQILRTSIVVLPVSGEVSAFAQAGGSVESEGRVEVVGKTKEEALAKLSQAVDEYCQFPIFRCETIGEPEVEVRLTLAERIRRFFLQIGG